MDISLRTESTNSDWLILGFCFFSNLINLGRDNYFSFLSFLPIAFSKIHLRVAPDLVAPSPNLAIRDFSSSISAAFTLSFILLV